MSARADLHRLADELPADLLEEVVSFGRYLLRACNGAGEAELAKIAGTPGRLARFQAAKEGKYE